MPEQTLSKNRFLIILQLFFSSLIKGFLFRFLVKVTWPFAIIKQLTNFEAYLLVELTCIQ